jgi:rhodanese-related sulfurtransferase
MEAFLVFLQKSPMNMGLFAATIVSGAMLIWPFLNRLSKPGKEVGAMEAVQLINRRDAVVIDVRDAAEYASGHIAGARHIPQAQLETRLKELEKVKSKPLIVACATGNRSRAASALLQKQGYAEVYNLQGGLAAWKQAGMPLEK